MRRIVPLLVAAAVLGTSGVASANLAPNPGFEESVLGPVPAMIPEYPQPILPTGWIFEGAAVLFDHRFANCASGRCAAISIPAGTPRQQRIDQLGLTVDSPLNIVKDAANPFYTVNPHWRTATAIPVLAGGCYVFGVNIGGEGALITTNQGAITQVRWVDALGVTVGVSPGPERRNTPDNPYPALNVFEFHAVAMGAPANAAGAILMLGHSDDLWISQVIFDDVYFNAC